MIDKLGLGPKARAVDLHGRDPGRSADCTRLFTPSPPRPSSAKTAAVITYTPERHLELEPGLRFSPDAVGWRACGTGAQSDAGERSQTTPSHLGGAVRIGPDLVARPHRGRAGFVAKPVSYFPKISGS